MTALLKYDAACRAITEAKTVDEVSEWLDKAAAVREYGRRAKNRQLVIDAVEIMARAKRRRGELLVELRNAGRLVTGPRPVLVTDQGPIDRVTLEELGVTKNESSEEQKIASISQQAYELMLAQGRQRLEQDDRKHSIDILREQRGGPVNGSRSVMGSRLEPADSLDYFPTPPWATRALIEIALRRLGVQFHAQTVWEPAAGEGHIAEVLREYFREVDASDIHDYGYANEIGDFLQIEPGGEDPDAPPPVDWIITNPPFGAHAEAFVLHALKHANVGVAMFLRLQWLETSGRYERIFLPHPPALIAQFAERVPLHKGRWEPEGDTATAYLWIVWLKKRAAKGTEFFWIPPGQREALHRADDVERFTAHPVIKKDHVVCDEGFDPSTGEITESGAASPASPEPAVVHGRGLAPAQRDYSDDGLDIPEFLRRRAG